MNFFDLAGFDLFLVKKQILKNRKNHLAKTICLIIIKKSQFSRLIYIYNILKFQSAINSRTGDMDPRPLALINTQQKIIGQKIEQPSPFVLRPTAGGPYLRF